MVIFPETIIMIVNMQRQSYIQGDCRLAQDKTELHSFEDGSGV